MELQRLEGRVKYYQEELGEQRAQFQQLNEKVIRFNTELVEYKNRLSEKEKELEEERNGKLEQQKMVEDLEGKMRDLEDQQRQWKQQQQQQGQQQERQQRRGEGFFGGPQHHEQQQRSSRSRIQPGMGVGDGHGRGYFDETESSIAPEDDIQSQPRHHRQPNSQPRQHQFSMQTISPQERSVAEIIASMLMEELERLEGGAAVRSRRHGQPDKSALEEISVKVALRLLWSARDRDRDVEGQRLSLQELLSDQRFLSDLIADTQVIPPPPSCPSSLLTLPRLVSISSLFLLSLSVRC
jgi:hypothetical protein